MDVAADRDLIGRPYDPDSLVIEPDPSHVAFTHPWIRCGRRLLRDPTAFLTGAHAEHGATFVVDAFGYRLLCVFSPAGVRTLYALDERTASFGLATFSLLRLKVPDEVFFGRRLTVPLPTKELVSTFGHGSHACPAARFSLATIRLTVRTLLDRYELTPEFSSAAPRCRQIGGVARAAAPCVVRYAAR